jgi:hypothetical protein
MISTGLLQSTTYSTLNIGLANNLNKQEEQSLSQLHKHLIFYIMNEKFTKLKNEGFAFFANPSTEEIQTVEGPTTVVHWKLFPESMRTEQLDRVVEFESDEADNILIDEAYGVALISKV